MVSLRGELQIRSNSTGGDYRIELLDAVHQNTVEQINIHEGGAFEFRNVPEGNYKVRVLRGMEILREEAVHVHRFGSNLYLRVNDDTPAGPRGEGVVSVRALQHQPDKRARKLFIEAEKLFKKDRLEESISKLREAVAIDADYMEAHNNLGSRLASAGRPAEALVCLERAAELEPAAPRVLANIGVVMMQLGRPKDAEAAARRALSGDPASHSAHYVLGLSLLRQQKARDQAISHLRTAGERFPHARLARATAFVANGQVDAARAELRTYLTTGQPDKKPEVEAWLNRLR